MDQNTVAGIISRGDLQGLQQFLNDGGNIQMFLFGYTPLSYAISCGQSQLVEFLIMRGADVNVIEINGTYPLLDAVVNGHTQIVQTLLRQNANVNALDSFGDTALHAAFRIRPSQDDYGMPDPYQEVIDLLLDAKGDLTIKNEEGKTPLQCKM